MAWNRATSWTNTTGRERAKAAADDLIDDADDIPKITPPSRQPPPSATVAENLDSFVRAAESWLKRAIGVPRSPRVVARAVLVPARTRPMSPNVLTSLTRAIAKTTKMLLMLDVT
jgi:hypothetical protein